MAATTYFKATEFLRTERSLSKNIWQLIGAITELVGVFMAKNILGPDLKLRMPNWKNPVFYIKAVALTYQIIKAIFMYVNNYPGFVEKYLNNPVDPLLNNLTEL